ncbi:MAG: hypothetical protein U0T84_11745 [Chitinophagales bacterium]
MTVYTLFGYIGIAALILTVLRIMLKTTNNWLVTYLQNFVGALFVFSGFVKAVDPMGTGFKMEEYFESMHLEVFNPLSLGMSVAMLVAELTLGVALLIGWKPRLTTILMLLLNVFFLLLTGYTYLSGFSPTNLFFVFALATAGVWCASAIVEKKGLRYGLMGAGAFMLLVLLATVKYSNLFFTESFDATKMKVTDCGCFGDFIKLKPWQTFYKDVVLTAMIFIVTIYYKSIRPLLNGLSRMAITAATGLVSLWFCCYNFLWNEPVIDFRPYAIGNDLNEMRREIKPQKVDFVFVYKNKKTGASKEFKTAELGNLTEDWEYVSRKDIVLEEGIPARISNLFIFNENKEDITEDLLHDDNYTLVVFAYKLDKTHACCFRNHLNEIAAKAKAKGITMYGLSNDDATPFKQKEGVSFPFYTADATPLKTAMRSNPGLMLLKNGVVVNKWHHRHLPTFEWLDQHYFSK